MIEILARSGVRASELCDMRLRDVRLHDPDGARFRILDSKTEAGIREVQMSPDLVETFVEHLDRLRRAGLSTGPDAYAVPNRAGARMTRQRVGQIVREAAEEATRDFVARGLRPLPHTTPHSLRRTYISIALLANNFDVKWVMSQVGHADSKMTLDVYAQLEQRVERSHGTAFDGSCGRPGSSSEPARSRPIRASIGPRMGHESQKSTRRLLRAWLRPPQNPAISSHFRRWRDPDSNRGHHDFQSCALPTELSRRAAVDASDSAY